MLEQGWLGRFVGALSPPTKPSPSLVLNTMEPGNSINLIQKVFLKVKTVFSCYLAIPEIIELVGNRTKYGGTFKNERL